MTTKKSDQVPEDAGASAPEAEEEKPAPPQVASDEGPGATSESFADEPVSEEDAVKAEADQRKSDFDVAVEDAQKRNEPVLVDPDSADTPLVGVSEDHLSLGVRARMAEARAKAEADKSK